MDKDYTPKVDDNFDKVKSKKSKKQSKKQHRYGDDLDENEDQFAERVLPKGTPMRKSFQVIPKQKKKFWRPEAKALRKLFPVAGIIHALCLVSDIWIYGEILIIIVDFILVWLDFYNYMVLNKILIAIEVGIQVMVPMIALTHIQRGLQDPDTTVVTMIIFILQMFVFYPLIAALMGKRLNTHYQQ